MKNILLASTALVAFAGAAAAQVEVSGTAEVGIVGGDFRYAGTDGDGVSQLWTDIEIDFIATGEADNGLTFGAEIDLDEAANGNGTDDGGATWFVAFGNARLDMGDTDGAVDWALQEVALAGGSIDDAETEHLGYNGNYGADGDYDGQIARVTYTYGDFAAALSTEIDDGGDFDPIWGVGFQYNADFAGTAVGFGIGYQKGDEDFSDATLVAATTALGLLPATATLEDEYDIASDIAAYEVIAASVDVTLNSGIMMGLNYAESKYGDAGTSGLGLGETEKYMGVGIGYEMNALAIGLNYGEYDDRYGIDGLETSGYGLAVAYDLGGGLAVQAGYGLSKVDVSGGDDFDADNYSLGLAMSF
ncbi:outer membrane protein OmpU [Sagittula marina]|uniref:Outer membrane protein OmpU n=1 Tax=Sagittula marina TaxID=943940 RepID=A0A7W6GR85_9RHOB|nr:porin [Sagittula marina]MBB3984333.1 outer membrane protein OmpU [Sagittula marina]